MRLGASCFIAALGAALGISPLAHAEILIGASGPLTGSMAWFGEQMQRGTNLMVAGLNAKGGVLGQQVEIMMVDDYCDPEQAVAAAEKLVQARVAAVIGHVCSGASIPASKVYADAGTLMISPISTNPTLTEQGFANVFRVCGRDTLQAALVADYLVERWGEEDIAIVHDGQAYGQGIAEEARRRLADHGVTEILFEAIEPSQVDYTSLIDKLEAAGIDALYFGGYTAEAARIIRQARARGYALEMIGSDALNSEFFWHVAGPAGVGVKFVASADPRSNPEAAAVVERFHAEGYKPEGLTLYAYAAVEVWAQAVEKAGSLATEAVVESLRSDRFDTILGHIGFDEKGDVYGFEPYVWYVWQEGEYIPLAAGGTGE